MRSSLFYFTTIRMLVRPLLAAAVGTTSSCESSCEFGCGYGRSCGYNRKLSCDQAQGIMRKGLETNIGVLCNERAISNGLLSSLHVLHAHEPFGYRIEQTSESMLTPSRSFVAEKRIGLDLKHNSNAPSLPSSLAVSVNEVERKTWK